MLPPVADFRKVYKKLFGFRGNSQISLDLATRKKAKIKS